MTHAVVILNWNGAPDTVECLRSIVAADAEAIPIVVDNGSADDSCEVLAAELRRLGYVTIDVSRDELPSVSAPTSGPRAMLVRNGENLGFAAGCNVGLRVAEQLQIDVTAFLNNDTIVEANALARIAQRVRSDPAWFAVLPLLTIHGTDRIWNCGGNISRLGFRTYHHAGARRSAVDLPAELPCTFFTGCCFAVRTSRFAERGGFSERFFFGEEDFELSLWMSDHGLRAVCLTDAVVHHKVSASISRAAGSVQASKIFVHYLNRLVHMRLRFGRFLWILWLGAYLPYVALLLAVKRVVPLGELPAYLGSVVRRAARQERVTRDDFQSILRGRAW